MLAVASANLKTCIRTPIASFAFTQLSSTSYVGAGRITIKHTTLPGVHAAMTSPIMLSTRAIDTAALACPSQIFKPLHLHNSAV
jgi:hypothetical protein